MSDQEWSSIKQCQSRDAVSLAFIWFGL